MPVWLRWNSSGRAWSVPLQRPKQEGHSHSSSIEELSWNAIHVITCGWCIWPPGCHHTGGKCALIGFQSFFEEWPGELPHSLSGSSAPCQLTDTYWVAHTHSSWPWIHIPIRTQYWSWTMPGFIMEVGSKNHVIVLVFVLSIYLLTLLTKIP